MLDVQSCHVHLILSGGKVPFGARIWGAFHGDMTCEGSPSSAEHGAWALSARLGPRGCGKAEGSAGIILMAKATSGPSGSSVMVGRRSFVIVLGRPLFWPLGPSARGGRRELLIRAL